MKQECVLLLHGLAESELRMLPIALSLRYAGYNTVTITYPSTHYPVEHLTQRYIAPLLKKYAHEPILHIVTHSLGGILLRYYLQFHSQENLKRVVMLTPAHQGSAVFEIYRRYPLLAVLLGPVIQQSGVGTHCFPCIFEDKIEYELGIIAGSLPLDPFSHFVLPWPHDGRTSVEGTKLSGMKDHIVIPASHEFITFNPYAIYQTQYFLEKGHFNKEIA